jgi:hypothetical protein
MDGVYLRIAKPIFSFLLVEVLPDSPGLEKGAGTAIHSPLMGKEGRNKDERDGGSDV